MQSVPWLTIGIITVLLVTSACSFPSFYRLVGRCEDQQVMIGGFLEGAQRYEAEPEKYRELCYEPMMWKIRNCNMPIGKTFN
jgi:hypothetical protein